MKMLEDSDQELSELDIESKTWNKLKKKIKTIGFLDGAEEGKKLSFQEGFNLGFLDGFKLGEFFGLQKGIKCCESEWLLSQTKKPNHNDKALNELLDQTCVICSTKKSEITCENETALKESEDLLTAHQVHINNLIATLKLELES